MPPTCDVVCVWCARDNHAACVRRDDSDACTCECTKAGPDAALDERASDADDPDDLQQAVSAGLRRDMVGLRDGARKFVDDHPREGEDIVQQVARVFNLWGE